MAFQSHHGPITRSKGGKIVEFEFQKPADSPEVSYQNETIPEGYDRNAENTDFENLSNHSGEASDVEQVEINTCMLQERCHSESALYSGVDTEVTQVRHFNEVAELKRENRSLKLDVMDLRKQLDRKSMELTTSQRIVSCTQSDLYKVSKELSESKYELSQIQEQLAHYRYMNSQYKTELDSMKSQNGLLKEELVKLQVNIEQSRMSVHDTHSTGNLNMDSSSSHMRQKNGVNTYDYHHGEYQQPRCDVEFSNFSRSSVRNSRSENAHIYPVQYGQSTVSNPGHSNSSINHTDEPKFRLPYFNGKSDFHSFWSVFKIGINKFNWDNAKQIEQLMCCLKEDALSYVTRLPVEVQASITLIYEALERRFGDHLLPEKYREKLTQVKKYHKESLEEYAARVENLVHKAYPTINPELLNTLTIENLLRGLPDTSLAYDVQTKRPTSVSETIRLLTWHECCKNNSKKRHEVRQVELEHMDVDYDSDIRKIGSKQPRYVTEERLEKRLDIFHKQIVTSNNEMKSELKGEISKLASTFKAISGNNSKQPEKTSKFSNVTCYTCQQKGHTSKFCALNKERQGNVPTKNSGIKGSNGQNDGHQGFSSVQKKSSN